MLPPGVFDPSAISEDDLGHLEFIVNSPSYQLVFKGYIANVIRSVERLMKDPSGARKDQYPNDFLAGQATALEGLVAFLDGILEQTNMARMANSQLTAPQDEYQRLRELGLMRHSGQAVEAVEVQKEIDRAMSEDY